MATLKELIEQRTALEVQIAEVRKQEMEKAIGQILSIMREYDIEPADVVHQAQKAKTGSKKTEQRPSLYRDPETKKEWSGRGRMPHWLIGKDVDSFKI